LFWSLLAILISVFVFFAGRRRRHSHAWTSGNRWSRLAHRYSAWHQYHKYFHHGQGHSILPFHTPRAGKLNLQQTRERCKDDGHTLLQRLIRDIEHVVEPDSQLDAEWSRFQQTLLSTSDQIQELCEKKQLSMNTFSAPARMELVATVKLMENELLCKLQPEILRLYLRLNQRQRLAFDRLFLNSPCFSGLDVGNH